MRNTLFSLDQMLAGDGRFTEHPIQFQHQDLFLQQSTKQINCIYYVPHRSSIVSASQCGLVPQMHLALIREEKEQKEGSAQSYIVEGGQKKGERNEEMNGIKMHLKCYFSHFIFTSAPLYYLARSIN